MGNMVQAKVKVQGTRPMFWHWFGPDALPLEKREKTGVAGNDPEEWRKTVLATKDGQLYILPTYVFGMMVEAAKYTKNGRATLMKPVSATLQIEEQKIMIDRWLPGFPNGSKCNLAIIDPPERDDELDVYLDVRGVRNPSTRARNVRYRVAANHGWTTEFTLVWDKTVVNRTQMEAILIDGGKLVGLGNGRAIGMGRFDVNEFDVIE